MGKRKSKTSKQKQAKAVAAASRVKAKTAAFGVAVRKGGGGWNGGDSGRTTAVGRGTRDRVPRNNSMEARREAKKTGLRGFGTRKFACGSAANALGEAQGAAARRGSPSEESREFDRQLESIQERLHRRQSGSGAKKRNGYGALALAPPILRASDKRTDEEMVADAANAVARGMAEIGGVTVPSAPPPSLANTPPSGIQETEGVVRPNLLQVLAARKREEWAIEERKQQEAAKARGSVDVNNPFAVLREESDDENDGGRGGGGGAATSNFSFAPASFSVSSQGATTAATSGGDDDDPDL